MKSLGLVLGLTVALNTSALAGGYASFGYGHHHHGGWYGFAPFALGLGVGALLTYPWERCYYPSYSYGYYPTYAYLQPQPASAQSGTALGAAKDVAAPEPVPTPEETVWVPSSPGAGTWVPDPEPYTYAPEPSKTAAKPSTSGEANSSVSITTSPGGIPVYSNMPAP